MFTLPCMRTKLRLLIALRSFSFARKDRNVNVSHVQDCDMVSPIRDSDSKARELEPLDLRYRDHNFAIASCLATPNEYCRNVHERLYTSTIE